MNNLIIDRPTSQQCMECEFSVLLVETADLNIMCPAIVCRKDVTKHTHDPKCIFFEEMKEMKDDDFYEILKQAQ